MPSQVHLALSEDSTSMFVNWALPTPTNYGKVKYGTNSLQYSQSANATYHQYVSTWDVYTSPFLYSATMTSLEPSTTYYYIVGDEATNIWSKEFTFQTIPDNSTKGIRIIAYGDQGDTAESHTLAHLMQDGHFPNFILHAGDIAYANGNSQIWDQYMGFIEDVAASTPYMVSPGNHEAKGGENFIPYSNLFAMPNNKFWYSINYGPIHVIALSTEHPFDSNSEQYQFLEQDLQSVNRTDQPWIFVFAHKPPFNSNANYGSFVDIRAAWHPLFVQYSVDLAIFGHEHSYERSYPLDKNGTPATMATGSITNPYVNLQSSPLYFVVGTGGEGLRDKWEHPQPSWSAHREATNNGFASIYVQGSEFVHWQFVRDDNLVSDEFYLCKTPPCDFSKDPNGGGITAGAADRVKSGAIVLLLLFVVFFV